MDHNRLDVSAKELVWDDPAAWADRFGIGPPGPVSVIDSDITTLTASADKVLKVNGPIPYLLNLEPHSYHDTELARKLWYRQVALDYKHELPVLTVLILLRKQADSPSLTGSYERHLPDGSLANRYNYRVVRLWHEDPDTYLTGGVNLVPLAPLTNVTEAGLPGLVQRMAERINPEPEPRSDKLWTATLLLMGWRYEDELAFRLLEGVWKNMRDSTTYQAILKEGRNEGLIEGRNEGRVAEAQRLLLMLGGNRFGEPNEATRGAVEAIHDVERLERMTMRVHDANVPDWEGLLNTA
jgi:hypothetical protein